MTDWIDELGPDEPLAKTPDFVVAILGFDPLEDDDDTVVAKSDGVDECGAGSPGGRGFRRGNTCAQRRNRGGTAVADEPEGSDMPIKEWVEGLVFGDEAEIEALKKAQEDPEFLRKLWESVKASVEESYNKILEDGAVVTEIPDVGEMRADLADAIINAMVEGYDPVSVTGIKELSWASLPTLDELKETYIEDNKWEHVDAILENLAYDDATKERVFREVAEKWGIDPDSYADASIHGSLKLDLDSLRAKDGNQIWQSELVWFNNDVQDKFREIAIDEATTLVESEFDGGTPDALYDSINEIVFQAVDEAVSTNELVRWYVREHGFHGRNIRPSTIATDKINPFGSGSPYFPDDAYYKTQNLARALQSERIKHWAKQLGEDPGETEGFATWQWDRWVRAIKEREPELLREAAEELFGANDGMSRTFDEMDAQPEERIPALINMLATWETSQFLLERSGINKITGWRGILVGDAPDVPVGSKLDDYNLEPVELQSFSTDPDIANGWNGVENFSALPVSSRRLVIRAAIPKEAIVSLPAYGDNEFGEQEIVVLGRDWEDEEIWKTTAPKEPIEGTDNERLKQ